MSLKNIADFNYCLAGTALGRCLVVCSRSLLEMTRLRAMRDAREGGGERVEYVFRVGDLSGHTPKLDREQIEAETSEGQTVPLSSNLIWIGESVADASNYLSQSDDKPDTLIVGMDYPQQHTVSEVEMLVRNHAWRNRFVLLGPWCQGATRTDVPWPAFERVFWHFVADWLAVAQPSSASDFGGTLRQEGQVGVDQSASQAKDWRNRAKLNATGQWVPEWTEWFLQHAQSYESKVGVKELADRGPSSWIFSATQESYWALSEALSVIGWDGEWLRLEASLRNDLPDLILVDCEFGLDPQKKLVLELAQLKVPVVVIVGFPTPEESAWIDELADVFLVDKPYWLGQIRQVAQRLFST